MAICVATRERPDGLQRLLEGISRLSFCQAARPQLVVNVADNDPAESARVICDGWRDEPAFRLNYDVEKQAGVSYARNKSVQLAPPDADYFAFIDDDELPDVEWLDRLLHVAQLHSADVVSGPCIPVLPAGTPAWAARGKFFEWPRHETGQRLTSAATHNALIDGDVVREFAPLFDPRFALSGGEDTHLFMRLNQAGRSIVWSDEAIVREWIAPSRINPKWILLRGYRMFSSHTICEREMYPGPRIWATRTLTGLARITFGVLYLPVTLFLPKHEKLKALLQVFRGAGLISGLLGRQYQEYATIHKV